MLPAEGPGTTFTKPRTCSQTSPVLDTTHSPPTSFAPSGSKVEFFLPIKCSMHGTDVDGALLDPMDVGWAAFTLTTRPKLVEIRLRTFFIIIIIDALRISQCQC